MYECLGRKTVLVHKTLSSSLGRLGEELILFTLMHFCVV